jgi:phosphatidate cytidylyltransferase
MDDDGSLSPTARARRVAGSRPRPVPAPTSSNGAQPEPAAARPVTDTTADEGAPAAKASRAGRNLPAAIAVGIGLAALIVASLFVYRPSFGYLVGAAVLYGTYELGQALAKSGVRVTLVPLLVGAVALLFAAWLRGPNGLVLATLVTFGGVVVWRIADGPDGYLRDVTASALVLLYVPTLAGFAILLARPDDGAGRILAFVATVVCSDTGGYATGVFLGKHPLAPVVSKAKTWEGFAGSVAWCSVCGILFMALCFHESWWKGWLFGLAVVVTATLGDLGESMIKRDLGMKDMGDLLPGHGGIMDRLDSLLPCAAVAYLLLSHFAPH